MAANLATTDSSFVQMVILTADRQKATLTQTEASEIEKFIFDMICATTGKRPRFKGRYVFSNEDGAIIINTHVDSANWLKEVSAMYKQKALRITDIKNSPRYTAAVATEVTKVDTKVVDNLLDLLEAHNVGLKTHGWRFVRTYSKYDRYYKENSTHAMYLVDDPGREMLERNDFKFYLGFSTITFTLLRRVKRCETSGVIYNDNIKSQDD